MHGFESEEYSAAGLQLERTCRIRYSAKGMMGLAARWPKGNSDMIACRGVRNSYYTDHLENGIVVPVRTSRTGGATKFHRKCDRMRLLCHDTTVIPGYLIPQTDICVPSWAAAAICSNCSYIYIYIAAAGFTSSYPWRGPWDGFIPHNLNTRCTLYHTPSADFDL